MSDQNQSIVHSKSSIQSGRVLASEDTESSVDSDVSLVRSASSPPADVQFLHNIQQVKFHFLRHEMVRLRIPLYERLKRMSKGKTLASFATPGISICKLIFLLFN